MNFLPKFLSPSPAAGVESQPTVPSKQDPPAHAVPAVETPPAALLHVYVATFVIRNPKTKKLTTEVVEVPHRDGKTKENQRNAWKAIRAKHPNVGKDDIRRSAGHVTSRVGGKAPVVEYREGQTIRQLFPDGTEFEAAREIGTIVFDESLCYVVLRHLRARGAFSVSLRTVGGSTVRFSEQVTTQRLVEDLPGILKDIIGDEAATLKLYLKKHEQPNK